MVLVGLMLIALVLGLMRPAADTLSTIPDAVRFDEPAGRQLEATAGVIVAKRQVIPVGLARAYAAIGEQADGKGARLSSLDDDASRYLDQARKLFAEQILKRNPGPSTKASGTGSPVPAVNDAQFVDAPVTVTRTGDRISTQPRSGVALNPVDERALPQQFTIGDKNASSSPIIGDLDKELIAPDAWVAIPYKPGLTQGRPLTIRNTSGAGYAISLHGTDFGTVRVNGGLVIPGRFYQIHTGVEITSDVPVNVHIRPLGVVSDYHDMPVMPSANG